MLLLVFLVLSKNGIFLFLRGNRKKKSPFYGWGWYDIAIADDYDDDDDDHEHGRMSIGCDKGGLIWDI